MTVGTQGCEGRGEVRHPAARPVPAGTRPARPPETRGTVRPAGRRAPAAVPPARPRVTAGGGAGGPAGSPVAPAVVRRRRVAAVAVLGALLGVLLGVLVALVGSADASPAPAPSATTVTVVGAGESLSDVAGRVAPGADTGAVVARIRDLNSLDDANGSALAPGRPLVVPATAS